MIRKNSNGIQRLLAWLTVFAVFAMPVSVFAQTQIKYHSNKYKPADDVKVGRQAAAEVEQQMPILNDNEATSYVSRVGQRLVNAIPPEFQHPEFQYYFKIVNARDINAFALPGGPMYVNRGMIEAARNEGEMAGVMAHELSPRRSASRHCPGVQGAKVWFARRDSRHWRPDYRWPSGSGRADCRSGSWCLFPEVQPRI